MGRKSNGWSPMDGGRRPMSIFMVAVIEGWLWLGVEDPTQQTVIYGEVTPNPAYQRYKFSLRKNSRLLKDIESFYGHEMSKAEKDAFDPRSLLGETATVTIVRSEGGGKQYANIDLLEPHEGDLDGCEMEVFYYHDQEDRSNHCLLPAFLASQVARGFRSSQERPKTPEPPSPQQSLDFADLEDPEFIPASELRQRAQRRLLSLTHTIVDSPDVKEIAGVIGTLSEVLQSMGGQRP